MAKPALGRGLGALLGSGSMAVRTEGMANLPHSPEGSSASAERIQLIPTDQIHACPWQPRKEFPGEALDELAASIKEQGIVQPLLVRVRNDRYELIAGERRWRAAQLAGLSEVPVIVREADDRRVLEWALIENLQRENLNPIEEAQGYAQLVNQFQLRQEDVAQKVGKSRVVIANSLRLLKLPAEAQRWLREGRLTIGHAKAVLGLEREEDQLRLAKQVLAKNMNVRQTEELVARFQNGHPPPGALSATTSASVPVRDVHVTDLEERLQERFATKVQLRYRKGKGRLEIRFFNDDDLQRILEIIGITLD